jgi:hypothetical protein
MASERKMSEMSQRVCEPDNLSESNKGDEGGVLSEVQKTKYGS